METAKAAVVNLAEQYGFEELIPSKTSDSDSEGSPSPPSSSEDEDNQDRGDSVFFTASGPTGEGTPDQPYEDVVADSARDDMLRNAIAHDHQSLKQVSKKLQGETHWHRRR